MNIIQGSLAPSIVSTEEDLGYEYPFDLDLKPGSRTHDKIRQNVMQNADDSFSVMQRRHPSWQHIDQTLKVYIPLSDAEKVLKKVNETKPVSIVVPYSYVALETLLAYVMRTLLNGDVFLYEGVGPEDTVPAKLLELVVNQQVRRFKSILDMYIAMRDSFSYGIGATTMNWRQEWGLKPQLRDIPQFSSTGLQLPSISTKENVKALLFEGNEVINIDPYRLLPDPNCSIHNVKNMEFIGWIDFLSRNKMIASEVTGERFNVKYLPKGRGTQLNSKFQCDSSRRIMSKDERGTPNSASYITVIPMYCEIIPKDWGLPGTLEGNERGEYPEKWLFELANDNIVTKASPLNLNHNRFPIAIAAPDFDGYSITPLARLELIDGLQDALNFMFNSHVANVRKAINDTLIVDPSLVNMEDLKNPEPGKLIRLRRSAWGRGTANAVEQLKVFDVTKQNMVDAEQIMGMMSRGSAASDSTQGIIKERGERVSASEFNGTLGMAVSRLDRISKLVSVQYMQDLAYFHASHTQQLMSMNTFVKAAGDWPLELAQEFGNNYGGRAKVGPFDIIADFDVIFKDGSTIPLGQSELQFWIEGMKMIAQDQSLMQSFDIVKIFSHVARMSGANNVNDFIRRGGDVQVNQMGNQAIEQGTQTGDLVALEELQQQM